MPGPSQRELLRRFLELYQAVYDQLPNARARQEEANALFDRLAAGGEATLRLLDENLLPGGLIKEFSPALGGRPLSALVLAIARVHQHDRAVLLHARELITTLPRTPESLPLLARVAEMIRILLDGPAPNTSRP